MSVLRSTLKKFLPDPVIEYIQIFRSMREWRNRNFLENSPQLIKQKVFEKYGIRDAIWVESGTYMGVTTDFLSKKYPHVYSIEPGADLFNNAARRFKGRNVTLYNDVSEHVMPDLLPTLSGNINFWLDGHYSMGITFQGNKDCPVEDELESIKNNSDKFNNVTILIDDIRCFLGSNKGYSDYPSIDYLVDWARKYNYRWCIEHDIFIMQKI